MPDNATERTTERDQRLLESLLIGQQSISSSLAELPPSAELFQQVLSTVCETLGWSFGAAWQRATDSEALECVAVRNTTDSPELDVFGAASFNQSFEPGQGLPGHAWASAAPVWLPDLRWDGRMQSTAAAQRAGLRGAAAIPLNSGEGLEGVLEFFSHEVREPDEKVMAWLATTGAQLAQYLARWRAQEMLGDHARALGAAVNGIVIADATKRGFPIVYANPGFERLTGYSLADIRGRSCALLQGLETDPETVAEIAAALEAGRSSRVTLRNYRKDGSEFWNELHLSPVVNDDGELVQFIGVQNDVTEQRMAKDKADFLAHHDPLTGLANRSLLQKVLARSVARAQRHGLSVAVLNLDLDNFKRLNDTYGHVACDELLKTVADRLNAHARPSDLVVRQGGDEFLVLMTDLGADAQAVSLSLAERLQAAISQPIDFEGDQVTLRVSTGVSLLGRDAVDADALLRHADVAMYRAKRTGRPVKLYQATAAAERSPASAPADLDVASLGERAAELDRLLREGAVRAVYQPIVDLATREIVAYEALARGPEDSILSRPDQLFGTAQEAGRLAELDWACRSAAVRGALEHGLGRTRKLFINVEPLALGVPCPAAFTDLWRRAVDELDIVIELTERALTSRPAELLRAVSEIRRQGWGIALDDVGADVRSLALMPMLRPDVIKLDLRLVQEQPTAEVADIVHAVNAESERTGAVLLAEGIETQEHLTSALALGATTGQGWFFGRPGPLEEKPGAPQHLLTLRPPITARPGTTPFETVSPHRDVRRADKRLLLSISMNLEQKAVALGESGVILSAFQRAERFTPLTRRRYTLLASDAAFVGALGVEMEPTPAPGVRGAALDADDPLLGEWSVVVLGPHFAAALVASDLGDTGPEMERQFDFALTYERNLVIDAANALMARVTPFVS